VGSPGKAKTRQKMMNVVPMSTGIIWRMRLTMYLNMVFLTTPSVRRN